MISIRVLFLGPGREVAGVESAVFGLADGVSVGDLRGLLAERYPKLGGVMDSIRFAVNEAFADDAAVLSDGDEVALIPPVSGGSGDDGILVEIAHAPIARERLRAFVENDVGCGAVVAFEGVTRQDSDPQHGLIRRLEYEAHESMAVKEMRRLVREAIAKWKLRRVAMVHRVGSVPVGEASVLIIVAGGHRGESFEACRWLIEALKQDVPIWKKDVFEDGHVRWVGPNQ